MINIKPDIRANITLTKEKLLSFLQNIILIH